MTNQSKVIYIAKALARYLSHNIRYSLMEFSDCCDNAFVENNFED